MNKLDDFILVVILILLLFVIAFVGYEFRGKVECERIKGHVYSLDYGKCVRVEVIE